MIYMAGIVVMLMILILALVREYFEVFWTF
jgi:hypothetical protein